MGIYDKYLLPRLLDLAMRNKEVARYRRQLLPRARGTVLEVGVGSGLNMPFYGSEVDRLYAVDPSPELLRMAGEKARSGGCNLDRKIDSLIADAQFRVTEVTAEYAKGPRLLSYVYTGQASNSLVVGPRRGCPQPMTTGVGLKGR